MHNIPDDCVNRIDAPWNQPDQIEPKNKVICWACDEEEENCECLDGFDPREVECE